jgi:hypothetical protein
MESCCVLSHGHYSLGVALKALEIVRLPPCSPTLPTYASGPSTASYLPREEDPFSKDLIILGLLGA